MNAYIQKIDLFVALGLLTLFTLLYSFTWVGYTSSDDSLYADGARAWIEHGLYLGELHWHLRYPQVIPLALSFLFFGESEFTLALPNLIYLLATVLITYVYLSYLFDRWVATVTCVLLIFIPLFAVQVSIAGIDIPEMFFVVSSVFLFHYATDKQLVKLIFIAGLIGGLGWLSRETSAGLAIAYMAFFVLFDRKNFKTYLILAAGFSIIPLLEFLIYFISTGDAFYRIHIDLIQSGNVVHEGLAVQGRETGNIQVGQLFDPFLAILVNQEFGFLFYLLPPAIILTLRKSQNLSASQNKIILMAIVVLIAWFITIGYILGVRELPRYFSVTAYFTIFVVGIWIATLAKQNSKLGILVFTFLITSNIACLYIENKNPLFGERTLLQASLEFNEVIYTDLITHRKADFLTMNAGTFERTSEDQAPHNSLFLYNPNRVLEKTIRPKGYDEQYQPQLTWAKVKTYEPERIGLGEILEWTKVDQLLPESLKNRLNYANQPTILYRIQ